MSSIKEIERAIEQLPPSQVDELAGWLDELRANRGPRSAADQWLQRARGAAKPGETTSKIMDLTRGEE